MSGKDKKIVVIILCMIVIFAKGLTYKKTLQEIFTPTPFSIWMSKLYSPPIQKNLEQSNREADIATNSILVKSWVHKSSNNVENVNQNNFIWRFNMSDPLRTYEQYHGVLILFPDGTGKCIQCVYNETVKLEGRPYDSDGYSLIKWSFDENTLLLTLDWTYGGQYNVGGYFEGTITGNRNKFNIQGHWYNGSAGTLHFERINSLSEN